MEEGWKKNGENWKRKRGGGGGGRIDGDGKRMRRERKE